jgi:2-hydroxychromene-2-carboxylate isomerase
VRQLRAILVGLGKDPDGTIGRADGREIRDRYDAETEHAKSLGVFGAPTFVCGKEIFWGDDRLEDAIEWCKSVPG